MCRRGRSWDEFRAVPPICTRMGEPTWPADGRCPGRSGETNRCESPKRWFMLPILTIAGVTSEFPTWNAITGTLTAITAEIPNDNEASIFDLSGLTSFNVDFDGGGLGSGVFFAIALPIPIPPAVMLFSSAIGLLVFSSRRSSRLRGDKFK